MSTFDKPRGTYKAPKEPRPDELPTDSKLVSRRCTRQPCIFIGLPNVTKDLWCKESCGL